MGCAPLGGPRWGDGGAERRQRVYHRTSRGQRRQADRRTHLSARILVVSLGGADSGRLSSPLIALGHDVISVSGPAAAQRELAQHDLVIVDGDQATAVADACRRLRTAAAPGLLIMAVGQSHDVEERIALLEAGADDVLGRPYDQRQLELLTEAVLSRMAMPPVSGDVQQPAAAGANGRPGRVICFASAKGGAGTTTLAVNTAVTLAKRGLSVAIADLDFHHGQVATHLDVKPIHTTAELAATEGLEDQPQALLDSAVSHASGVRVYAAPDRPDRASMLGADHVIELVRGMRAAHRLVVVDAGSVPGTRALALLGLADESVIVVSPDIPGLRSLTGMLAVMADSGITGEQNRFVVNRTFAAQAIGRGDIEQSLGVSVSLEIPFDGESCLRAVNEGQPVVMLNPRSPVAAAIERLCSLVVAGDAGPEAEPARRGRLGGLLGRR